ncbi:MAG: hypothetical protein QW286_00705 [Candidatus Aenigmatarchaeota archaeon]
MRIQPEFPLKRKGSKETNQEVKDNENKRRRIFYFGIIAALFLAVLLAAIWTYPKPQTYPVLSDSAVIAEMERLKVVNSEPKKINPSDYPKVLGIYWKNNLTLVEQYYCSDVCPDYGRVDLVFQGIDSADCPSVEGRVLRDLAWGGYVGCEPRL